MYELGWQHVRELKVFSYKGEMYKRFIQEVERRGVMNLLEFDTLKKSGGYMKANVLAMHLKKLYGLKESYNTMKPFSKNEFM